MPDMHPSLDDKAFEPIGFALLQVAQQFAKKRGNFGCPEAHEIYAAALHLLYELAVDPEGTLATALRKAILLAQLVPKETPHA